MPLPVTYLRSFIALMLFVVLPLCSNGQCPSDKYQLEIAASYGMITADQLGDRIAANNNTAANSGGKTQTYNSGAYFVTIRYFLYNRLALEAAIGRTEERGKTTDTHNPGTLVSTYKQGINTIALELYYIYFFRKYVEVYTLLGAGPSFTAGTTTAEPNSSTPNAVTTLSSETLRVQYTPIGIRVGGRLGAFAELGVGYKGLLNAGVSFKIGPSCWWRP